MKVLLKYLLCAAALLACPVLRAQMGNDPYADAAEENEAEANRTVEPYTNLLTVDEPYRLVRNVLLVGEGEWLRAFGPYGGNADGGASYAAVVNRYAEAFPEVQVYIVFDEPNFKFKVGDFRTRLEAYAFLQKIKEFYKGYVTKDNISPDPPQQLEFAPDDEMSGDE